VSGKKPSDSIGFSGESKVASTVRALQLSLNDRADVPVLGRFLEGAALLGELLVLLYAGVVGFVAAGITASFYRWITSEPARFGLFGQTAAGMVTTFVFCALTGPVIVMDHAIRSRKVEKSPLGWFAVGTLVAALWSCCLGLVVLEVVLSIRGTA
jgi:hypothetical protein